MPRQEKKEAAAATATLKEKIMVEFEKMTLQQIQQLKEKHPNQIGSLVLHEIRENVRLIDKLSYNTTRIDRHDNR
jgi:hypothetical protein